MRYLLFPFAKTWLGGVLLGWVIAHLSVLVPGEKLIETEILLAFLHPTPSYPLHILILPKGRYRSLQDLPSPDLAFEKGLFQAVNQLVERFNLKQRGYRLIVNGGSAQEVSHLHFHLISENIEE